MLKNSTMINRIVFILFFLLFPAHSAKAQVYGCTDQLSTNYNSSATINDGSCVYFSATISPTASYLLNSALVETSGLIYWNNQLWTHNDSDDINLYALDTIGDIVQSYPLNNTLNKDWEEISQDDKFIYIGDFGNNNGNRTDLKILRITKKSLISNSPVIDTIRFAYSNQTDFNSAGSNKTDFDCEAFIVSSDSIFLFTKQWVSNKTGVYSLAKSAGNHIAQYKFTIDIQGLITGATYLESKKLIVLCGYTSFLQPFLYALYDFKGTDYLIGNKRKIQLALPFHQVEAVATNDGLKYYITNEYFSKPPITTNPQKMHVLDLQQYLSNYLNPTLGISETETIPHKTVYPVPAHDFLVLGNQTPTNYCFKNQFGQIALQGFAPDNNSIIDISTLSIGIYFVTIGEKNPITFKVLKR